MQADNDNNIFSSYNIFLALTIFSLIQQLTSRNRYLKLSIQKIAAFEEKGSAIFTIKQVFVTIENMILRVYYNFGVWIAYGVIMTLSLTLSITIMRWVTLLFLFLIMLLHLKSLRAASVSSNGGCNLVVVNKLWVYFFRLKISTVVFLIVGTFIL